MAFRSEGDARAWERVRGVDPGATVPVEVLGKLSLRWYGGRLADAWRPLTAAEKQTLLHEARLRGPFWDLG